MLSFSFFLQERHKRKCSRSPSTEENLWIAGGTDHTGSKWVLYCRDHTLSQATALSMQGLVSAVCMAVLYGSVQHRYKAGCGGITLCLRKKASHPWLLLEESGSKAFFAKPRQTAVSLVTRNTEGREVGVLILPVIGLGAERDAQGPKGGSAQPSAQGNVLHTLLWPILSTSQGAVGLLVDVLAPLAPERWSTRGTKLCRMCKGNPKGKSTCCKYLGVINTRSQWNMKPRWFRTSPCQTHLFLAVFFMGRTIRKLCNLLFAWF